MRALGHARWLSACVNVWGITLKAYLCHELCSTLPRGWPNGLRCAAHSNAHTAVCRYLAQSSLSHHRPGCDQRTRIAHAPAPLCHARCNPSPALDCAMLRLHKTTMRLPKRRSANRCHAAAHHELSAMLHSLPPAYSASSSTSKSLSTSRYRSRSSSMARRRSARRCTAAPASWVPASV